MVEVSLKRMLEKMSAYLNQPAKEELLRQECLSLRGFVRQAQERAQEFEENHFFLETAIILSILPCGDFN